MADLGNYFREFAWKVKGFAKNGLQIARFLVLGVVVVLAFVFAFVCATDYSADKERRALEESEKAKQDSVWSLLVEKSLRAAEIEHELEKLNEKLPKLGAEAEKDVERSKYYIATIKFKCLQQVSYKCPLSLAARMWSRIAENDEISTGACIVYAECVENSQESTREKTEARERELQDLKNKRWNLIVEKNRLIQIDLDGPIRERLGIKRQPWF